MKIGELARAAQTPVETIRYYEREGLLPAPPRSEGNYRLYGDTHRQRLAFIRHCRGLDMTLDEVRLLLQVRDDPQGGCEAADALLDAHIDHVSARIRELRDLQKELEALRQQCTGGQDAAHCGVLQGLEQTPRPRKRAAHVHGAHGH